jgi:fluoroquinolone transport system ATP-binding protein
MSDIDQLCDRVAFIVNGEIKEIDSPRNLKIRYGKRTVKVEYKEDNQIKSKEYPLTEISENRDFIDIIKSKDIETIHSGETTLEDIFVKVTGVNLDNES